MRIGYACLAVALEGAQLRTCTLKTAAPERLLSLAGANFAALEHMIDYNITNNISFFRISSDIVPFGSSRANELPWDIELADRLSAIAEKIKASNMRVSMHPGQYTVLNSPNAGVWPPTAFSVCRWPSPPCRSTCMCRAFMPSMPACRWRCWVGCCSARGCSSARRAATRSRPSG